jgi:hypothetical protein
VGEWFEITQDRINQFAERHVTLWLHGRTWLPYTLTDTVSHWHGNTGRTSISRPQVGR